MRRSDAAVKGQSLIAVVSLMTVVVCQVEAATIRVDATGSGDFTTVFDATRAVEDGDTISIAPGVYDEFRSVSMDGYTIDAIGFITASGIHVVGDNRDSVFIGPPGPPGPANDALRYGLIAWFPAEGVSVSNLSVQNVPRGIADTEFAVSIQQCRIVGAYYSLVNLGVGEARIEDCDFEAAQFGVIAYVRPGVQRDVLVERSTFLDCMDAVQLQGVNGRVVDCQFDGGRGGVTILNGAHVLVESCRFADTSVHGVRVGAASNLWLYSSDFRGLISRAVNVQTGGLTGEANRLAAGSLALLWLASPSTLEFEGNHFLNAGGLSVSAGSNPATPVTVVLPNNWWGTTDLEQIGGWIYDATDEPERTGMTVNVLPLADAPISTNPGTMGGLKGRFRRD